MTSSQLLLLLGSALCATAFAAWTYARREVAVRGRPWLVALRALVFTLVLVLLVNPTIPSDAAPVGSARTWIALDASMSMTVGTPGTPTPWERAIAMSEAGDAVVATFGRELAFSAEDPALLERTPAAVGSLLTPLLERALEAGAREVVVISDLRLGDEQAVRALLRRTGLPVRIEDVGGEPANAGVARLELTPAVASGEAVTGEMAVFSSEISAGRTATVEVREEGRVVLRKDVELPAAGLLTPVPLELPIPASRGLLRYEARVRVGDDAFPEDDARAVYVAVEPDEGLLVGVALTPDWEMRFLLPLLAEATGLSARGYLRVGPDAYLPTGDQLQPPVSGEEVRRRVEGSGLVVLQGLAASDPEWMRDAAGAGRALVLPRDVAGAAAAGVQVGSPLPGEWYATGEVPPSAISPDLMGASWQGLPPLTDLLPPSGGEQGEAPLRLQLRASGGSQPALLLVTGDGGRRAVALGAGFWRWAFRGGTSRDVYRRLWSSVAGWVLADGAPIGGSLVRPVTRINARGERVRWTSPGLVGKELKLSLTSNDSVQVDTTLTVPEGGAFETPLLPPGAYRYSAQVVGSDTPPIDGRVEVEPYTDELRLPRVRDLNLGSARVAPEPRGRRPLRTHPAPYILVLSLLSLEWTLRRRAGLR